MVNEQELRSVRIESRVDWAIGNVSLLTLSDRLMEDEPGLEGSAYDFVIRSVVAGRQFVGNKQHRSSFDLGAWWWWPKQKMMCGSAGVDDSPSTDDGTSFGENIINAT
jgi:hypothetical protein